MRACRPIWPPIWVFIDTNEKTCESGDFSWGLQDKALWGGVPADRHALSAGLSFIDGHVESWRWKWPKKKLDYRDPWANEADASDFKRLFDGRPRAY